jgi:hypothetical protein
MTHELPYLLHQKELRNLSVSYRDEKVHQFMGILIMRILRTKHFELLHKFIVVQFIICGDRMTNHHA